jgi:hypothetical protein
MVISLAQLPQATKIARIISLIFFHSVQGSNWNISSVPVSRFDSGFFSQVMLFAIFYCTIQDFSTISLVSVLSFNENIILDVPLSHRLVPSVEVMRFHTF